MAATESATDALPVQNLTIGTYYVGVGDDISLVKSAQFKWDALLAATITFEDSNLPDAAINSVVAGEWIPENPSSAVISVVGGSATAATITVPGTTAGGAMVHLGNLGSRRMRAKIVVTTLGSLRVRTHGKV